MLFNKYHANMCLINSSRVVHIFVGKQPILDGAKPISELMLGYFNMTLRS